MLTPTGMVHCVCIARALQANSILLYNMFYSAYYNILQGAGRAGALLFVLLVYTSLQAQEVKVSISASATGRQLTDSTCYLKEYHRGEYVMVDSAKPVNGTVLFKRKAKTPAVGRIIIPGLPVIDLILQPAEKTITLAGNYSNFLDGSYMVLNSKENQCMLTYKREEKEFNEFFSYAFNMVQNTTIANPSHQLFDSAVEMATAKHNRKMNEIAASYGGTFCATKVIPNRLIPARSEKPEWLKNYALNDSMLHDHFLDYLHLDDTIVKDLPSFYELLSTYRKLYIRNNLQAHKQMLQKLLDKSTASALRSYLFAWLLKDAVQQSKAEIVTFLLSAFPDVLIKQSKEEKDFPLALKNILPGNKAFDIQLPDTAGKLVTLSGLAKRNPHTLLFFYSHDCDHCLQTIEPLKQYCKRNQLPETSVLAVDLHPDDTGWKKFVDEEHLPFTNVHLTATTAAIIGKAYAIIGTPTLLIVDSNLVITQLYPDVHR